MTSKCLLALFFAATQLWSNPPQYLQSRLKNAILLNRGNAHGPTTQASVNALVALAKDKNFKLDVVQDSKKFNEQDLKNYQVVLFIQNRTIGFTEAEKKAFENWFKQGGGVFATHAATASQNWNYYHEIMGARLAPHSDVIPTNITVSSKSHPVMQGLDITNLRWTDEWFYWQEDPSTKPGVEVLLTVDFSKPEFDPGKHKHPVPVRAVYPNAWVKETDGGRFITWGGTHTTEALEDFPAFFNGFVFNSLKYVARYDTVSECGNSSMCTAIGPSSTVSKYESRNKIEFLAAIINSKNWKILDSKGKIIHRGKGGNGDVPDLPRGLYFFKIQDNHGTHVYKYVELNSKLISSRNQ